ncbi:glycoside hydrolase family 88 protein [Croceibacterium sp. TMG7-5b_MA50]|uniref:glycoside hydrolase family 88 protein n=1 Tax=Croceibacterium sp. TMG7-5b_MA50 TaxID=3121290 RepID=UPI003221AD39
MKRILSRGLLLATALASNPVLAQAGAAPAAASVAGVESAWLTVPARPAVTFSPDAVPDRAAVARMLDYVTAAQIADMARRPIPLTTGGALDSMSSNWVAATFYVGAARVARISDDPRALRFLSNVADHYNYAFRGARESRTLLNADDMAIGDLYQELYARRRQQGVLMPLQQRLDHQVPYFNRTTEADDPLIWWWCDALFMAPPVMARMSALTGDPKYLRAMDKEWRRTAERLWVPEEGLFLRDERFADRRSENDRPIYWARGNGWVLAGLARTLEAMPADYEGREFYLDIFRKLAARTAELQQSDGLWRASLLDPEAFPEAETSGSALLVYGLAWGINHGLLDRETMLPHVTRGWAALNDQILPSGLLGAVQKTGDQPVPTAAEDTGPYGTGPYLLAGLEMMGLSQPVATLPVAQPTKDDAETIAATTPTPPPPATVRGEAEQRRRAEEMRATRALAFDPDAAPTRPANIEPLTPPTAAEQRVVAVARFAPDRFDDLLWENDRVAFRMYGPALEKQEPPSGSGIDVWAKRVRYPFMDRQLRFPNYHTDRGEGLDYYDVGRGRGVGGLGIWHDNKLWTSRNFAEHEVLATGGNEARFRVRYAPWPVDVERSVAEERVASLPLGTNFTRFTSTLTSSSQEPLVVAIGISKRPGNAAGPGFVTKDAAAGLLAFWEPPHPQNGSMGLAIRVDPAMVAGFAEDADNYMILLNVTPSQPFTYYSGAAWENGLDFNDRASWEAYARAERLDFAPAR